MLFLTAFHLSSFAELSIFSLLKDLADCTQIYKLEKINAENKGFKPLFVLILTFF